MDSLKYLIILLIVSHSRSSGISVPSILETFQDFVALNDGGDIEEDFFSPKQLKILQNGLVFENRVSGRNCLKQRKEEVIESSNKIVQLMGQYLPPIAKEVAGVNLCENASFPFQDFCDKVDDRINLKCEKEFQSKGFTVLECCNSILDEITDELKSHNNRLISAINSIETRSQMMKKILLDQTKISDHLVSIRSKTRKQERMVNIEFPQPKDIKEDPEVYYTCPLLYGFMPGSQIKVTGRITEKYERFSVNLMYTTEKATEPAHAVLINPRFFEKQVVLNSFRNNHWEIEERHMITQRLPAGPHTFFRQNQTLEIVIQAKKEKFDVYVDGVFFASFNHRLQPSQISHFNIDGGFEPMKTKYETIFDSFQTNDILGDLNKSYFESWCWIGKTHSDPNVSQLAAMRYELKNHKAKLARAMTKYNVIDMDTIMNSQSEVEMAITKSKKTLTLYDGYKSNLVEQQNYWAQVEEDFIDKLKNNSDVGSNNLTMATQVFEMMGNLSWRLPIYLDNLKNQMESNSLSESCQDPKPGTSFINALIPNEDNNEDDTSNDRIEEYDNDSYS